MHLSPVGEIAWQARFYDHIIRDESSLRSIRQYIRDTPLKWDMDENNPKNLKGKWPANKNHPTLTYQGQFYEPNSGSDQPAPLDTAV